MHFSELITSKLWIRRAIICYTKKSLKWNKELTKVLRSKSLIWLLILKRLDWLFRFSFNFKSEYNYKPNKDNVVLKIVQFFWAMSLVHIQLSINAIEEKLLFWLHKLFFKITMLTKSFKASCGSKKSCKKDLAGLSVYIFIEFYNKRELPQIRSTWLVVEMHWIYCVESCL